MPRSSSSSVSGTNGSSTGSTGALCAGPAELLLGCPGWKAFSAYGMVLSESAVLGGAGDAALLSLRLLTDSGVSFFLHGTCIGSIAAGRLGVSGGVRLRPELGVSSLNGAAVGDPGGRGF